MAYKRIIILFNIRYRYKNQDRDIKMKVKIYIDMIIQREISEGVIHVMDYCIQLSFTGPNSKPISTPPS